MKVLGRAGLQGFFEEQFLALVSLKANTSTAACSLKLMTKVLHRFHQKQVIVLLDEYDSPLIDAYHHGFYRETLNMVRNMLSEAFKDNSYVAKGVISGILRVAKESIFIGLNNLATSTVLDQDYSQWFGLSPAEVQQALADFEMANHYPEVEAWYNGYLFGGRPTYNPWSIISYLRSPEKGLVPHWVNTSSNELISQLLTKADNRTIQKIEALIQGQTVTTWLQEHTVFTDLDRANDTTLLSFLVFSGYIKAHFLKQEGRDRWFTVEVPNQEVLWLYETILGNNLSAQYSREGATELLQHLLAGRTEEFAHALQLYVISAFSYFDVSEPQAERIYHGFMLGVLAFLHTTHQVLSNRETGLGRAEMLLMPRKTDNPRAYVLEFKQAPSANQLDATAEAGLRQITNKLYHTHIKNQGKTQITLYAIAFYGKQLAVKSVGITV